MIGDYICETIPIFIDDDDNDFDIHLQGINNINDHQRTATLTAPTLNHTPATSLTTSAADQHTDNTTTNNNSNTDIDDDYYAM